jgi:hypothetical protein
MKEEGRRGQGREEEALHPRLGEERQEDDVGSFCHHPKFLNSMECKINKIIIINLQEKGTPDI